MKPLRAILIDDERICLLSLKTLLDTFPEINVIAQHTHPAEAIPSINHEKPDILFLDVQMPDLSGFDLLEKLTCSPRIIFVTSSDAFAVRAFQINALDYIVKPIDPERLAHTISRILKNLPSKSPQASLQPDDLVFLPLDGKQMFIRAHAIRYITAKGNYTHLYLEDKRRFIVKRSLASWETMLPPEHFFRLNRNELIHLTAISEITPNANGTSLIHLSFDHPPLTASRRQTTTLHQLLNPPKP